MVGLTRLLAKLMCWHIPAAPNSAVYVLTVRGVLSLCRQIKKSLSPCQSHTAAVQLYSVLAPKHHNQQFRPLQRQATVFFSHEENEAHSGHLIRFSGFILAPRNGDKVLTRRS